MITETKRIIWDSKYNDEEQYVGGKRSTEAWKFINNIRKNKKQISLEIVTGKD